MVLHTDSELETAQIGEKLGLMLRAGDFVALYGGLGAGKTVFTRGIARSLGVSEHVTSPTFTIVNEYEGRLPLFHFDAYRLDGGDALYELGWDEYLDRGGVTVVEWSENIAGWLPDNAIKVEITRTGDTSRDIAVTGVTKWD